jgi:hypothetical protein
MRIPLVSLRIRIRIRLRMKMRRRRRRREEEEEMSNTIFLGVSSKHERIIPQEGPSLLWTVLSKCHVHH